MPKSSSYAIAVGVRARPVPPAKPNPGRSGGAVETRNAADAFYFQLESFLDSWRHEGTGEEVVRAALKRAEATSLAMEDVGKRLKGR